MFESFGVIANTADVPEGLLIMEQTKQNYENNSFIKNNLSFDKTTFLPNDNFNQNIYDILNN